MKNIFYFLLFASTFFIKNANACTCFFIDNFCEFATNPNTGEIGDNISIHHIKVQEKTPEGVSVEVIQTFHGNDFSGKTISLFDGDGGLCFMGTDTFSVNEEYIINAHLYNNDLYLSICGVSFLKIENNIILGQVTPGIDQLPLSDFASLMECGEMKLTATNEESDLQNITISPTLANHTVLVKATSSNYYDLDITIFNAAGQLVYKKRQDNFNLNTELNIDINNWSDGIYFFRLNINGHFKTEKIIKQKYF